MSEIAEEVVIRKSDRVKAPIERAFSVFVEQMETWWPATHHIGSTPFEAIFIEPRIGGRWYERNAEGQQCSWGTVLAWNAPHLVRLSWHVNHNPETGEWGFDPDLAKASEVEIRFTSEPGGITLVELEHSKLERHGQDTEKLRNMYAGAGAWSAILGEFAKAVETTVAE